MPNVTGDTLVWAVLACGAIAAVAGLLARGCGKTGDLNRIGAAR